ncbi:MAG: extracellular solute-binding protein [Rhizobiales bacterium]|nr:extracellular solute-binding protein [Hyphomicrobiales bacterium]NRB12906.1 extracellular solute-binding protein [Hyphomicrobiales bacterium]
MYKIKIRNLIGAVLVGQTALFGAQAFAETKTEVTISHYFTGELGLGGLKEIFSEFEKESGLTVKDSPIGHEDYKAGILVRAAGHNLPDVISYWAGARTQFIIDSKSLRPIDGMWAKNNLDNVIAKSVADGATLYDGKRYLVPFGYHYAGMFYNTSVLESVGVTSTPKTWEEFLTLCATLKSNGIDPIALGSKNRWPAQFWFDYLLLRTAGADYRADLMNGTAAYDDPEVVKAMSMWKDLYDAGYFVENSNANTWTDASDKVMRGDAAMTLMGTWITGYWNGQGMKPGEDYEFFPFPTIDASIPDAVVGPIDGLVISADAENVEGAEELLNFMVSNTEAQAKWANIQGALSANVNVDQSNYTSVMQHALATINAADTFAFNYDLSTPPPVAEVGLSMFAEFMDDPSKMDAILERVAGDAASAFKN